MHIKVYYYGKLKQRYLQDGITDYRAKISNYCSLDFREIKDNPKLLSKEQKLAKIPIDEKTLNESYLIALHEKGTMFDSLGFARFIQNTHKNMTFLIGPPAGIDAKIIREAHQSLSLSLMTFNHEHVLLILLEQLYRAHTIIHKHPYHK